ncbi:MAG: hypothetical protein WCN98_08495 [Verrucomicrobiaceae bacterium]
MTGQVGDIYDPFPVADFINHAVVSHTNPPKMTLALELEGTGRPGIGRQCFDADKDAFRDWWRQFSSSFRAERAKVIV